jgi:TyrR family helix-turn-helix protein
MLVFKERGHRIEIEDLPQEFILSYQKSNESTPDLEVPEHMIEALARGKRQLSHVVDEFEKSILNRLACQDLSQTRLAENLGITRRTLYNKLQKYNIRSS